MSAIAERLNDLVSKHPDRVDRLMAAIALLADDRPDEEPTLSELDRLAEPLAPGAGADEVVRHVFGRLAFQGDTASYHRAANSYLHRVLARRRGIPITLAAVAAEIGRRVEVELSVVGLPGHVVLGEGREPSRWFDPFAGGAPLDLEDCGQLFARLHPTHRFQPGLLVVLDARSFVTRMLNNLKVAHQRSGDLVRLSQVLTVTSELEWSPLGERVELARVLGASGRDEQAARVWEQLVDLDPHRAPTHRAAMRRHLARRN